MQSRVTDHRIGLTIHGLDDMLAGGQTFLTITDALAEQHLVRSVGSTDTGTTSRHCVVAGSSSMP